MVWESALADNLHNKGVFTWTNRSDFLALKAKFCIALSQFLGEFCLGASRLRIPKSVTIIQSHRPDSSQELSDKSQERKMLTFALLFLTIIV